MYKRQALMAAISTVVMFFEFTFPPFPPFLKFDLSGLPILLTAFIMEMCIRDR